MISAELAYIQSIKDHFDEHGLLQGTTFVCKVCTKQLPKREYKIKLSEKEGSSASGVEVDDDENSNDEDDDDDNDKDPGSMVEDIGLSGGGHVSANGDVDSDEVKEADVSSSSDKRARKRPYPTVPKHSLLLGLWTGPVPECMKDLTTVEKSMISIYSPVTKISLQGGTHFKTQGGTSFTVVNDLIQIAQKLPVMATPESIGILRSKKGTTARDYTYRPLKVKTCLEWLIQNNCVHAEFNDLNPLVFDDNDLVQESSEGCTNTWESNDFVEPKVMELSQEDMDSLEKEMEELPNVTTNTGNENRKYEE
jgi:hypothetical protein